MPALIGCSQSFWDRSPQGYRGSVKGIYVPGPLADANDPAQPWQAPILTGDPDAGGLEVGSLTGDPDGSSAARGPSIPMPSQHDLACLAEVNRVRAQHGVPAVQFESRLFAAAYLHSHEQMTDGFLGHDSRDPSRATLGQRMQKQGYVGRTYAEVVAKDFPDARSVVAAWMDSPRHREVLLDPDLMEAAFARVDAPGNRTNRWTGDFADPGRAFTPIPASPKPSVAQPSIGTPAQVTNAHVPGAQASSPQVPNPALRASVPPTTASRGSDSMPPARPPIPSAAPTSPAPVASQPAPSAPYAAPQQPRVLSSAPSSPSGNGSGGNIVPPPNGARVTAPAQPYLPSGATSQPGVARTQPSPSYAQPGYTQPSAPRVAPPAPSTPRTGMPSAPFTAQAPRSTSVPPAPRYQPAPQPPRKQYKRCGPGG